MSKVQKLLIASVALVTAGVVVPAQTSWGGFIPYWLNGNWMMLKPDGSFAIDTVGGTISCVQSSPNLPPKFTHEIHSGLGPFVLLGGTDYLLVFINGSLGEEGTDYSLTGASLAILSTSTFVPVGSVPAIDVVYYVIQTQ